MRHVADKVVLHLRHLLLAHHQIHGDDERKKQDDRENHGRRYHLHHIRDIHIQIREMHLYIPHLSRRVVAEERLRERMLAALLHIVLATVHLTAVRRVYYEMERQRHTVAFQRLLDAVVQHARIQTVSQVLLRCTVQDP